MSDYKMYSIKQMINIVKNKGFYFVETSNGDNYIIEKSDLPDFIFLEVDRCKQKCDLEVFSPVRNEPILTTYGWFLNRVNSILRDEIIDRLVKLQRYEIKPKKVKIFDNEYFIKHSDELVKIDSQKFFEKYYEKG